MTDEPNARSPEASETKVLHPAAVAIRHVLALARGETPASDLGMPSDMALMYVDEIAGAYERQAQEATQQPDVPDAPAIHQLTGQIDLALQYGQGQLALLGALALPDICAALESSDGESTRSRYKEWCDLWIIPKYAGYLESTDLYYMRCGVVHQARVMHDKSQYARIIFTTPNARQFVGHQNTIETGPGKWALNLDLVTFCHDIITAAHEWYESNRDQPNVMINLPNMMQYYPEGSPHFIPKVPVIT